MHVFDCSLNFIVRCTLRSETHSRLSRRLCYEHVWHLKARLQRFQLIYFHPRHIPLQSVQLQQQVHLQTARWQTKSAKILAF